MMTAHANYVIILNNRDNESLKTFLSRCARKLKLYRYALLTSFYQFTIFFYIDLELRTVTEHVAILREQCNAYPDIMRILDRIPSCSENCTNTGTCFNDVISTVTLVGKRCGSCPRGYFGNGKNCTKKTCANCFR